MICAVIVSCDLGPKLGLVVRKRLASLGSNIQKLDGALATRAFLRLKVTQIGTTMSPPPPRPLETLALSGSEEALILVW